MYVQVAFKGKNAVYVETIDQCYKCDNQGVCPLIWALAEKMTSLNFETINVGNCGMFNREQKPVGLRRIK